MAGATDFPPTSEGVPADTASMTSARHPSTAPTARADDAPAAPADEPLVRTPDIEQLDRYLEDLALLADLEQAAEEDHRRAADLDVWQPTAYEQFYLPGLRLAGVQDKQRVVLQNAADLHMHTQYSDGDRLERVLEQALEARLDVIAITDHDEIEGALEARRIVHEQRLKIAVVPGVEVSSRDGHIGALFVTRPIDQGMSAADTVAAIHAAGGLAVAHHPFAPPLIEKLLRVKLGCGELVHQVPFDAIEATNAVPGYGRRYNLEAHAELERRQVRIGMTASSDAHLATFVGKGQTYFAGNEGVASLRLAMEHGFLRGSEGYWTTKDKLVYRWHLVKAVWRQLTGRNSKRSVN